LIGGSKEDPRPLPIGPGFAVQEDNVAVEYNIPPSFSKDEFTGNIRKAMHHLSDMVAGMGLHFVNVSATEFPMEQMGDPKAFEFGCDPDFNAWRDGKRNPRPTAASKLLRTCGGHVHVGYEFLSPEDIISFVQHMDLFLGVPSVMMDKGELRKQLYGKAGAFRPKPYGCEYRSLSNFWVFNEEHTRWVWDSTALALDAWQNNKIDMSSEGPLIVRAINRNNKDIASSLIGKYNLLCATV
jgi:hypothetical protein